VSNKAETMISTSAVDTPTLFSCTNASGSNSQEKSLLHSLARTRKMASYSQV